MNYRILMPYQAIGTIGKTEYHKYASIYRRHGNQHSRTLYAPDMDIFRIIRNEYKQREGVK